MKPRSVLISLVPATAPSSSTSCLAHGTKGVNWYKNPLYVTACSALPFSSLIKGLGWMWGWNPSFPAFWHSHCSVVTPGHPERRQGHNSAWTAQKQLVGPVILHDFSCPQPASGLFVSGSVKSVHFKVWKYLFKRQKNVLLCSNWW